ncbi:MAG: hypothetical protein IPP15_12575 [Saprospiraceae bacterium]|uniref:Uncharacterized protein n=1 Tax=Candidatus Opimibacter skivensis TaxID=2982028 RepID=A0A9D7SVW8_9BACT|nr:hypothetical protein [Candidatus Opimibacter skivensis]
MKDGTFTEQVNICRMGQYPHPSSLKTMQPTPKKENLPNKAQGDYKPTTNTSTWILYNSSMMSVLHKL